MEPVTQRRKMRTFLGPYPIKPDGILWKVEVKKLGVLAWLPATTSTKRNPCPREGSKMCDLQRMEHCGKPPLLMTSNKKSNIRSFMVCAEQSITFEPKHLFKIVSDALSELSSVHMESLQGSA